MERAPSPKRLAPCPEREWHFRRASTSRPPPLARQRQRACTRSSGASAGVGRERLLPFVHPGSERSVVPQRHDCSIAEKQESNPARSLVVPHRLSAGRLARCETLARIQEEQRAGRGTRPTSALPSRGGNDQPQTTEPWFAVGPGTQNHASCDRRYPLTRAKWMPPAELASLLVDRNQSGDRATSAKVSVVRKCGVEVVVVETGGDRPVVGELDLVAAGARGLVGKAALRERSE
jgi:hypothetical protein